MQYARQGKAKKKKKKKKLAVKREGRNRAGVTMVLSVLRLRWGPGASHWGRRPSRALRASVSACLSQHLALRCKCLPAAAVVLDLLFIVELS